jgi:hypothetical protein
MKPSFKPLASCAHSWVVLPGMALLMAGCASNAVVLSTATRNGVEINTTEAGQQGAHVGFERFEGVIMPIVGTNQNGKTIYLNEAYPIYSKYYFHSGGLLAKLASKDDRGLILKQAFATGRAATNESVRTQVDKDFNRLKAHVGDLAAFDQRNKLLDLIYKVANTRTPFEEQVRTAVKEVFGDQMQADSLEGASAAVKAATGPADKAKIELVIKKLGL